MALMPFAFIPLSLRRILREASLEPNLRHDLLKLLIVEQRLRKLRRHVGSVGAALSDERAQLFDEPPRQLLYRRAAMDICAVCPVHTQPVVGDAGVNLKQVSAIAPRACIGAA